MFSAMPPSSDVSVAERYRLVAMLGSGAMGTVWHAHDTRLNRPVAIKELRPPPDLDDNERDVFYRRTLREARVPARLKHPSIIDVYDVVIEHGCPWIVMELVEAPNLDQLIERRGPLPSDQVAEIARQLLDALGAAHAAGILHRDIKPSNVLVTGAGRVVLTDFGLAISDGSARITASDNFMGSPAYVAPEVAKGGGASPASDLWSLGATLYTAAEGRPPFDRENVMATLSAVLTEEPPPLQRAGPLTPLIRGLLQKNPARRLSHERATDRVERAIAGPRTSLHPRDQARRRLMIVGLIAGICALCGIAIGALIVGMSATSGSGHQPAAAIIPSSGGASADQAATMAASHDLVILAVGDDCQPYVGNPATNEVVLNTQLARGQMEETGPDGPELTVVINDAAACRVWIKGQDQGVGQQGERKTYTVPH
jgi:tRNA A-37 threonylcarbamoyl transferase component Bud32